MRCQADVAERVAAAPTPQAAASLREGPPDWAPDTRCARPIQDLRCVIYRPSTAVGYSCARLFVVVKNDVIRLASCYVCT